MDARHQSKSQHKRHQCDCDRQWSAAFGRLQNVHRGGQGAEPAALVGAHRQHEWFGWRWAPTRAAGSAPIASQTIHAGATLSISNSASDPDLPAQTLAFSLDPGAPPGAVINPTNGLFTLSTSDDDVNTTNSITVRVTDNGSPPRSDARSFVVTIVSRPVLQSLNISNQLVTMTWTAITGQTYWVQYADAPVASHWSNLAPAVMATNSVATASDSVSSLGQRFYRIQLAP